MSNKAISLKTNSRRHFKSQVQPSLFEQTFTIEDLRSPNYIDSIAFASQHSSIEHTTHKLLVDRTPLTHMIDKVEATFDEIKRQVDDLRRSFIHKLMAFYTDDNKEEETLNLKVEMRKCHQRLLESPKLDSKTLENLTTLLDRYMKLKDKSNNLTAEGKTEKITIVLEIVSKELQGTIMKAQEAYCSRPWENVNTMNIVNKKIEHRFDLLR